jgi:hypothetical protein
MRFNTLHHIHKMLQNCCRKSFLKIKTQELPGASLSLETLSGPQTSRRLSSPVTQNPGSAPDHNYYLILLSNVAEHC